MCGGRRPRVGALALEGVEQRRRLAADVAPGALVQVDVEGEARAEDVPAEVAALARLGERPLERRRAAVVLGAQEDVAGVGLERVAGQSHTLYQKVRVALEQVAVLEAARLHLVAVADHVLGPRRVGAEWHGAPLAAGRVAGAAAPAQARVGDRLRHLRRRQLLEGAGQSLRSLPAAT